MLRNHEWIHFELICGRSLSTNKALNDRNYNEKHVYRDRLKNDEIMSESVLSSLRCVVPGRPVWGWPSIRNYHRARSLCPSRPEIQKSKIIRNRCENLKRRMTYQFFAWQWFFSNGPNFQAFDFEVFLFGQPIVPAVSRAALRRVSLAVRGVEPQTAISELAAHHLMMYQNMNLGS